MYSSCFSTTRDWNNLSPEIRNSGNINIFKRKIKILLEKVPFYFGWGDRKLNIIHSRLRNMCSSLNADLHLVHLKPSPACICGHGFKDCIHFFLECPYICISNYHVYVPLIAITIRSFPRPWYISRFVARVIREMSLFM